MGRALRAIGIGCEVYPEARNISRQMKYADRRGFRFCLIAGPDEFNVGQWQIRDLKLASQTSVPSASVPAHLQNLLSQPAQ
jgi:histidyl-tRNA synthetase